ncbi:MAG: hypothetical protein ACYC1K_03285 [Minisyncoccota bacterium]
MKKIFNLAIAVPSGALWHADFSISLIMLMLALQKHAVPGYTDRSVRIINKRTSILPKSRHELIEDALKEGCTHLLFVDTDQTFPAFLVHQLASHGKRVVGCNIATKSLPASPTARNFNLKWAGGDVVYTDHDSTGLEQVWRLGCGVLLIDLSVIAQLRKPYFAVEWHEGMQDFVGEDWFFCQRLEEKAIPIYIDHDMSKQIGHIGNLTYTHDLVGTLEQENTDGQDEGKGQGKEAEKTDETVLMKSAGY